LVFYNHFTRPYFTGTLSDSQEQWVQFGDYIGGVLNPFFSFLALIAILYSIVLQNHELKLSRDELERSAKALQKQSEEFVVQNFENTFFQMVRLHNDIVSGIAVYRDFTSYQLICRGRDSFKWFYERSFTNFYILKSDLLAGESDLKIIQAAYGDFFSEYQSEVGHYFRNLYTIIRFLENMSLSMLQSTKKHIPLYDLKAYGEQDLLRYMND
jgi:hypothetical protein